MFTRITLHNFKSFEYVEFNLATAKGMPKHLAVVYGENGMGKSNLMESIAFLIDLMRTMDVRDMWERMLEDANLHEMGEDFFGYLRRQLRDLKNMVSDCYMIGAIDPMTLIYEFDVEGRKGVYQVSFDAESGELVHERLEYTLDKNKGVYFDITPEGFKLNRKVFVDTQFLTDFQVLLRKFWGKHTLLAILLHEAHDKSDKYIKDSISEKFDLLLMALSHISCFLKTGHEERGYHPSTTQLPPDLESGKISFHSQDKLDRAAEMLTDLFHAINSDNKKLYYEYKGKKEKTVDYQLYISKLIGGQQREIPFERESTGNHRILDIIGFLFEAINGNTAVIDEIDMGIHDILMKKILEEAAPFIRGQLIVTSHNTLLMEISAVRDAIYIISEDERANKEIKCINGYEERTYQQNNIRNKYMHADYKGVPRIDRIDFERLLDFIQ